MSTSWASATNRSYRRCEVKSRSDLPKSVGIKLTIDAQAGEDGPIQLDLDVEISRLVPSIAGDPAIVGPTFLEQQVVANARLNDGEAAIIAMNSDTRMAEGIAGTPWLSSLPVFGWLFTRKVERTEDVRLVLAAQARRVGSPAALAADTIRRRLAFERRRAQGDALPTVGPDEPAFAVLVTTRTRREDADAIAESLGIRGFQTEIHAWSQGEGEYWDVYVISLESMAEAAKVASTLTKDGWQTDIAVLPTRTRS